MRLETTREAGDKTMDNEDGDKLKERDNIEVRGNYEDR
jgi:hypothetical protein